MVSVVKRWEHLTECRPGGSAADWERRRNEMRKRILLIRSVVLVVTVGWVCPVHTASPEGENLALGKPYTYNGLPSKKWEALVVNKVGAIPDYRRILTDGETQETPSFWSARSTRCSCPVTWTVRAN